MTVRKNTITLTDARFSPTLLLEIVNKQLPRIANKLLRVFATFQHSARHTVYSHLPTSLCWATTNKTKKGLHSWKKGHFCKNSWEETYIVFFLTTVGSRSLLRRKYSKGLSEELDIAFWTEFEIRKLTFPFFSLLGKYIVDVESMWRGPRPNQW